ncbi:IucA/IucC family protein [Psychromonas sp. psych-6C06]|uniref:IucA/IucC family protein n=1 Tax=Psychromonas sp. psych-6C06 TaxID=2058089 RepID=UPI00187CA162|nr:IucA/IucC family protein [Psychromonas sp. psych-6C06]
MTQISSEQRVIKQLIEALLFEGVINYQLQHGVFTFQLNNQDYKATGKIAGFARIRLHADKIFCKIGEQWHAPKIDELVKQLPTTACLQKKLRTELMQTITLCNWNQQNLPRLASRRELPYTQLESAIDEGHPYHPCFKARTGFTAQDHHDYGPESRNPFQLHWLAVDRALLKHQLNSEDIQLFWLQELGENIYQQLQQRLTDAQATFEKYSLLPIHPWQWQNLQTQFSIPLATKEIIDLGSAGDHYQASISVRTLLNISQPKKANIKLPLNMVNTSSLRTIESHSICTAPILTNWLTEIVKSDQYLQRHITLLPEYAGIRMRTQTDESPLAWLHALDGQTGVIFRESLMNKHAPMNSVPFVALSIIEKDTLPFIDPWIQEYGCQAWLEQLIKTAVLPIWHLLVHHGIALEAHAQNLILQHQQGWPTHITLRDFHESLEYVPSFLKTPALTPDFLALEAVYQHAEPNQYYWMEDVEALRELVIDTLFVFNLSDLATLLEDHYQFNESDFWQHIYQAFVDYQQTGQTDEARIRKMDIHQPSVQTESLIKKKLSPTAASEFHHTVNNPLLRVSPIISPLHVTKTRSLTC